MTLKMNSMNLPRGISLVRDLYQSKMIVLIHTFYINQRFLNSDGVIFVCFLNALLKADFELKPDFSLIASIVYFPKSVFINSCLASLILYEFINDTKLYPNSLFITIDK